MSFKLGLGIASLRSAYSPASLFGSSPGDYWVNDPAYYFTDTAGTTPVVSVGDQVAAWRGALRGTLLIQATALSRPLWGQASGVNYLTFDGLNDLLASASLDYSATGSMSVFMGLRKESDVAQSMALEFGPPAANGSFNIQAPNFTASPGYSAGSRGTAISTAVRETGYAAPVANYVSLLAKISTDTAVLWVNDTQEALSATDQGTGNYGNQSMNIGARSNGTLPFSGRVHSLIVCGRDFTASEATAARAWTKTRMGI
jgi:hypothetical protein